MLSDKDNFLTNVSSKESNQFGAGIPAHNSLTCNNVPGPHQENQVPQKGSLPLTI